MNLLLCFSHRIGFFGINIARFVTFVDINAIASTAFVKANSNGEPKKPVLIHFFLFMTQPLIVRETTTPKTEKKNQNKAARSIFRTLDMNGRLNKNDEKESNKI